MRRREELTNGNGKSKMTVMMFQLEGGDETLRDGIRSISQAMSTVLNSSRTLATKQAASLPAPETSEAEVLEPELNLGSPAIDETPEPASRRPSPSVSKPRSPKILSLDLKAAKVPLKEFCESKSVGENDSRRYLVISYWLKEQLSIPTVTMDHIHTCYRTLGWLTPADASSPLRNMKQSGWFDKGTEKGSYAINHVGENAVMELGGSSHEA